MTIERAVDLATKALAILAVVAAGSGGVMTMMGFTLWRPSDEITAIKARLAIVEQRTKNDSSELTQAVRLLCAASTRRDANLVGACTHQPTREELNTQPRNP
jgi:hypothetical protein